jgi:hypothetical protein
LIKFFFWGGTFAQKQSLAHRKVTQKEVKIGGLITLFETVFSCGSLHGPLIFWVETLIPPTAS